MRRRGSAELTAEFVDFGVRFGPECLDGEASNVKQRETHRCQDDRQRQFTYEHRRSPYDRREQRYAEAGGAQRGAGPVGPRLGFGEQGGDAQSVAGCCVPGLASAGPCAGDDQRHDTCCGRAHIAGAEQAGEQQCGDGRNDRAVGEVGPRVGQRELEQQVIHAEQCARRSLGAGRGEWRLERVLR